MTDTSSIISSELIPQLLYRIDGGEARFATWRLTEGHETLALFTTAEFAENYRASLADSRAWAVYQPPRDKLLEVLRASRAAGILYAALDPVNGVAKTLFDIPRVLASAENPSLSRET